MKKFFIIIILLAASVLSISAANDGGQIQTRNISVHNDGTRVVASFDMVLDDVKLGSNHQIFVTPYIEGADNERVDFPSVLVNGRNMQYVYERSGLSKDIAARYSNISNVVRRKNGTAQTINYTEGIPMQNWMKEKELTFSLAIDTCGCGANEGSGLAGITTVNFQPYHFFTAYITPEVTELPVAIHEGKARVQFEVDKIVLHTEPYVCKSGQKIDNREQLKVIEDSIAYALKDPNVELASIKVCGYASPESPYIHNEYLATNRSRALAEYIGKRYNLPQDRCTYDAVTENWPEFREQVVAAKDITETQRKDLLALIDKRTYGPADFDAKEKTLKTDPKFADLYATKILPVWFPKLRCTKFAISTRLKPASDEKLAEIIKTHPEMLSLNQMFRVARLYQEGSKEFNETIETALRFYKDDETANLNAAVAKIQADDYDTAAELLKKAGNTPEAENARGVVAAHNEDMEAALQHFENAGNLNEAQLNKAQLEK